MSRSMAGKSGTRGTGRYMFMEAWLRQSPEDTPKSHRSIGGALGGCLRQSGDRDRLSRQLGDPRASSQELLCSSDLCQAIDETGDQFVKQRTDLTNLGI